MSIRGLELLRDLTEIINTSQALDNLCNGSAAPFTSDDFKVFRGNKNNTSVLSYIPNTFTFYTSAFELLGNKVSVKGALDIESDIINLNIGVNDKINGGGVSNDAIIERVDVYPDETNIYGLPVTELILNSIVDGETFTGDVYITKQNSANIQNNFFILGSDIQNSFYNGDKITNIIYPLSSTALPLLNINTRPLYVVDLFIDVEERINFGLSDEIDGDRIDLTSLNPLSVINLYRNNEVTQSDILHILPPVTREPRESSITSSDKRVILEKYADSTATFNSCFNDIQRECDTYLVPVDTKINLSKDNVSNLDITIDGVLKVEDPDTLNNNIISNETYTPSIYVIDPVQGNINNKKRIFSSFDGPWITTANTLSTNKDIVVGDLNFDDGVVVDNLDISSIENTALQPNSYNRKIPIYIQDSDGLVSTYFLLAKTVS